MAGSLIEYLNESIRCAAHSHFECAAQKFSNMSDLFLNN